MIAFAALFAFMGITSGMYAERVLLMAIGGFGVGFFAVVFWMILNR